MKNVYPIILKKDGSFYFVDIPDLNISTQGTTIPEAMEMARDAIGIWGISQQDLGLDIPLSANLQPKSEPNDLVALIDIDFTEYRRKHDNKVVRKNCTIPSWLNEAAEKQGVNFSAILQEAIKEHLNI